jgi:hypothetical protein
MIIASDYGSFPQSLLSTSKELLDLRVFRFFRETLQYVFSGEKKRIHIFSQSNIRSTLREHLPETFRFATKQLDAWGYNHQQILNDEWI